MAEGLRQQSDSSVYHQWCPIHLSAHRFQFSSTWVRMQMWTCQSNPSSSPWPWEPVLVVSLYFYPRRVIKYKQSMRLLGLGLKTHLPYSHWGLRSLSLLKGVDLYWWLLPEGDISCSMWQPHFVQRCHSPGRSGCAFFVGAAQGPVSSPHSGSTTRQRPARQHTVALLGWEGHKGRET